MGLVFSSGGGGGGGAGAGGPRIKGLQPVFASASSAIGEGQSCQRDPVERLESV